MPRQLPTRAGVPSSLLSDMWIRNAGADSIDTLVVAPDR